MFCLSFLLSSTLFAQDYFLFIRPNGTIRIDNNSNSVPVNIIGFDFGLRTKEWLSFFSSYEYQTIQIKDRGISLVSNNFGLGLEFSKEIYKGFYPFASASLMIHLTSNSYFGGSESLNSFNFNGGIGWRNPSLFAECGLVYSNSFGYDYWWPIDSMWSLKLSLGIVIFKI